MVNRSVDAPDDASLPDKLIFVSSVEEDRRTVDALIDALESRGYRCWAAHRDIIPGEMSWAGAIVAAIVGSTLMVVVVSANACLSRQVLREVTIADDEGVPFLPFRVDASELSPDFRYYFSTSQQLDASHLPQTQAIGALCRAVLARFSDVNRRPTPG